MNAKLALDGWLSTRGGSLEEIRKRYALSDKPAARNVRYEKLLGVDRYVSPAHPGLFFFFKGQALVMLYVSAPQDWKDSAALMKALGGAGVSLRSRAGKPNVLHVYPQKGVALSENGEIDFVEVFPPTTLERYRAEIYEDPGPFTK